MANLVCPYPPKKTIISGGTVFAVFDLGQIAYQGPVWAAQTLFQAIWAVAIQVAKVLTKNLVDCFIFDKVLNLIL